MFPNTYIFLFCFFKSSVISLTLPHHHPNPEAVVQEFHRRVHESISRRQTLDTTNVNSREQTSRLTGNPIDDCWKCDPNWSNNRQRLADCSIGFGQAAAGGKGGLIYTVTDSSDDAVNPAPGTLRYGVIQTEPMWIVFASDMVIKLTHELILNSYKTIDGRGANVHITGGGCITLNEVNNVIISNIHVHHCVPTGSTNIRSSPSQVGHRGKSEGDGISIHGSSNVWIDHCDLSYCTDGLIDVTRGSTAVTISNNYFSHHEKVMLLGHSDDYLQDSGMQVTVAFNHFGEELVERMPRCRHGYFHVVNNDYSPWKMYAIGGSANPTINSQGNRFTAASDGDSKEVTKREDADKGEWAKWNWRTEGDIMVNGAFFVPSGDDFTTQYAKASSVEPKSAVMIDQLTAGAGVLGSSRGVSGGPGGSNGGTGGYYGGYYGMIIGSCAPSSLSSSTTIFLLSLFTIILCNITNNLLKK